MLATLRPVSLGFVRLGDDRWWRSFRKWRQARSRQRACDCPWPAVTVKAVSATPVEGQARKSGAVETPPSKEHEDTTLKGTRAKMSLGFALAPIPQASAVAYWLEYAAALDSTA